MDIYENIVIGTFLYNLGLEIGLRGRSALDLSTAPIQLQQTPLDPSFGDVLIANPRVVRLIEFKRAAARVKKEKAKLRVLRRILKSLPAEFEELSRQVHWYVESESY